MGMTAEEIMEWGGKSPYNTCPPIDVLDRLIENERSETVEHLVWRFFSKVKRPPRGEVGCWEWTGFLNRGGYGQFHFNGRAVMAHRLSYLIFWGSEHEKRGTYIRGLLMMHACDNRKCVSPYHLSPGDFQENNDDMRRKGRARYVGGRGLNWGENNGKTILRAEQVREIRKLLAEGHLSQRKIGALFGVTQGAIFEIKKGNNWRKLL